MGTFVGARISKQEPTGSKELLGELVDRFGRGSRSDGLSVDDFWVTASGAKGDEKNVDMTSLVQPEAHYPSGLHRA